MPLAVKAWNPDHWKAREFPSAFLNGEEGEEIGWGGVGVSQRQLCCVTILTNWCKFKKQNRSLPPFFLLLLRFWNATSSTACAYHSLLIWLVGNLDGEEEGISHCSLTSLFLFSFMEKKTGIRNRERVIYTNAHQHAPWVSHHSLIQTSSNKKSYLISIF